jgi:sulfotransferase family protein
MNPLFVFGVARSGTSLLARVLAAHSQIEVALDPLMPLFKTIRSAIVGTDPAAPFQDFYQAAGGYALLDMLLAGDLSAPVAASELPALRAAVAARAALEAPDVAARAGDLAGGSCQALTASAFDIVAACRAGGTTRWVGIKEVWVLDFVPALARGFPAAKFIVIERDPRAVIASLAALAQSDPSQHAHPVSYLRHWRKSVVLARRFGQDPALAGRVCRVSYEDLVSRPAAIVRRLADFLGVGFEPGMLEPEEGPDGAARRAISDGSRARWRGSLPEPALRAVEFFCGPEMRMAGYRPVAADAGALTPSVRDYVDRAHAAPGSWRSDCGDPAAEIEFELLRRDLLHRHAAASDTDLVRRCFLFADAYAAARAAMVEGAAA